MGDMPADRQSVSSTISTIESIGSRDSGQLTDTPRLSTKIRAATLAWLWKFSDSPPELKEKCKEMRYLGDEIGVLHLCGCGICSIGPGGERMLGCCERSHLILGDHDLNMIHESYHRTIERTNPEDYELLCGIINRGHGGQGIF